MQLFKTVILTNPQETIDLLAEGIQKLDIKAIKIPLIQVQSVEISEKSLESIEDSEWLIITSKNSFKFLIQHLLKLGRDLPAHIQIATVGEKSAKYINERGYKVDFVSYGKSGKDFALQFINEKKSASKLFFPRGNKANPEVINLLMTNFDVAEIEVYATEQVVSENNELNHIVNNQLYDLVVFTSPSAVDAFMNCFNYKSNSAVSIGPVTTNRLRHYDIEPELEPQSPSYEEIIKEIKNYYHKTEKNYAISRS